MIRNFTQICNCYSVVNFHFLIGFFKPGYRINQSSDIHKGLLWVIFAKKASICDLFLISAKYHTASVSDCTLLQSMKFANRVFIIRWGFVFVYGQDWCFFRDLHQNLMF